jgi:hypothetical protein
MLDPQMNNKLLEDFLESVGGQMSMYHTQLKRNNYNLEIPDSVIGHYARVNGNDKEKTHKQMLARGWED